jgi:hypothetical protein
MIAVLAAAQSRPYVRPLPDRRMEILPMYDVKFSVSRADAGVVLSAVPALERSEGQDLHSGPQR